MKGVQLGEEALFVGPENSPILREILNWIQQRSIFESESAKKSSAIFKTKSSHSPRGFTNLMILGIKKNDVFNKKK